MRKLNRTTRTRVLSALVEGCSIRSTSRMTDVNKDTVMKLLVDVGTVCSAVQDELFRGLSCKRLQCDEIWAFVGCKEKNKGEKEGCGDVWTWTAIDAETKLVPSWHVGARDGETAKTFIDDLAGRLSHSVQITTDGHKPYLEAIEGAFGADVDYAMLVKIYGGAYGGTDTARRYSPAVCTGAKKTAIQGNPDMKHVSTSYVERQNLTMRMSMRRFTRLTNAFSKKVENHVQAISLHFFHYNLCRIHQSLRITPAMAAGVTDRVWDLGDLVDLLEKAEAEAAALNPVKVGRKPGQKSRVKVAVTP